MSLSQTLKLQSQDWTFRKKKTQNRLNFQISSKFMISAEISIHCSFANIWPIELIFGALSENFSLSIFRAVCGSPHFILGWYEPIPIKVLWRGGVGTLCQVGEIWSSEFVSCFAEGNVNGETPEREAARPLQPLRVFTFSNLMTTN